MGHTLDSPRIVFAPGVVQPCCPTKKVAAALGSQRDGSAQRLLAQEGRSPGAAPRMIVPAREAQPMTIILRIQCCSVARPNNAQSGSPRSSKLAITLPEYPLHMTLYRPKTGTFPFYRVSGVEQWSVVRRGCTGNGKHICTEGGNTTKSIIPK